MSGGLWAIVGVSEVMAAVATMVHVSKEFTGW